MILTRRRPRRILATKRRMLQSSVEVETLSICLGWLQKSRSARGGYVRMGRANARPRENSRVGGRARQGVGALLLLLLLRLQLQWLLLLLVGGWWLG